MVTPLLFGFLLLWKREVTGSQTQGSYYSGKGGYWFSNTRFLLLWKREVTGSQTQGSYSSGRGRLLVLKHKVLTSLEKGDYWFSNTRFLLLWKREITGSQTQGSYIGTHCCIKSYRVFAISLVITAACVLRHWFIDGMDRTE